MIFMDIGNGFVLTLLFKNGDIRAAYDKYSDIAMYERQQQFARKKDVVSRWFGEWDEVNGTAWQSAIVGNLSVSDALKKSARAWDELKKG